MNSTGTHVLVAAMVAGGLLPAGSGRAQEPIVDPSIIAGRWGELPDPAARDRV